MRTSLMNNVNNRKKTCLPCFRISVLCCLFLCSFSLSAQRSEVPQSIMEGEKFRRHSLYLELGGGGLLYGLGYEYLISKSVAFRVGTSYVRLTEKYSNKALDMLSVPWGFYYLCNVGKWHHFIELGLGANFVYMGSTLNSFIRENDLYINPQLYLGYRYHSKNGRWIFRSAFTPFYGTSSINDRRPNQQGFRITGLAGTSIQPWACLALGYKL